MCQSTSRIIQRTWIGIIPSTDSLRSHVEKSSHKRLRRAQVVVECSRQTKIGDLHFSLAICQQVVRFDVSVNHVLLVNVRETSQHTHGQSRQDLIVLASATQDDVLERSGAHVLHHQADRVLRSIDEGVVERNDVRTRSTKITNNNVEESLQGLTDCSC